MTLPLDPMTFDFDTPLSLKGIHCNKWDGTPHGMNAADIPEDAIPMWVADMDFAAAPPIRAALADEIDQGFLGYFGDAAPVTDAVCGWIDRNHGWQVDPSWVRYSVGVVGGVTLCVEAFTDPGDQVIVFSPVYHAFYGRVRAMGREIHESPLVERDGRYDMDLEALEASITERDKIVILCSPHNPSGRLWSAEEIRALAELCQRKGLLLVSDEIHMDLVYPRASFTPAALAAPELLSNLIVLTAASKAFNIAGGETGLAIIPDDKLRAAYDKTNKSVGGAINRFGMIMMKAAFSQGDDWSQAVRGYIAENFTIWRDRISALPGISVMDMSSTYLTWVDFRDTGMSNEEIRNRLTTEARLLPSAGTDFGTGGDGHMRFNIAMPRPLLLEAISRFEAAFGDLQ